MKTYNSREDLYTFPEVEEMFGISRVTINRWIKAGHFPAPLLFNKFSHNATKFWEKKLIDGYYKDHQPACEFRAKYLDADEMTGDSLARLKCKELEKENEVLKAKLERARKALSY
tara:strand:- start:129 stop:473 length:345 start_codon:yes stop_codon:yes gene_type:complete